MYFFTVTPGSSKNYVLKTEKGENVDYRKLGIPELLFEMLKTMFGHGVIFHLYHIDVSTVGMRVIHKRSIIDQPLMGERNGWYNGKNLSNLVLMYDIFELYKEKQDFLRLYAKNNDEFVDLNEFHSNVACGECIYEKDNENGNEYCDLCEESEDRKEYYRIRKLVANRGF